MAQMAHIRVWGAQFVLPIPEVRCSEMIFQASRLSGAFIIDPQRLDDERGFFARTFCRDEFAAHGLRLNFVQCNISLNSRKGTLRGMHYQDKPYEEAKLVRCTRGAIFDVIVDIRKKSVTYGQWFGIELTAENRRMLYVHGRVCAWLPDCGGRQRGFLPNGRNVQVRICERHPLE